MFVTKIKFRPARSDRIVYRGRLKITGPLGLLGFPSISTTELERKSIISPTETIIWEPNAFADLVEIEAYDVDYDGHEIVIEGLGPLKQKVGLAKKPDAWQEVRVQAVLV